MGSIVTLFLQGSLKVLRMKEDLAEHDLAVAKLSSQPLAILRKRDPHNFTVRGKDTFWSLIAENLRYCYCHDRYHVKF